MAIHDLTLYNDIWIKVDKTALQVGKYILDVDFGIVGPLLWHLEWMGLHSEASSAQLGLRYPLTVGTYLPNEYSGIMSLFLSDFS